VPGEQDEQRTEIGEQLGDADRDGSRGATDLVNGGRERRDFAFLSFAKTVRRRVVDETRPLPGCDPTDDELRAHPRLPGPPRARGTKRQIDRSVRCTRGLPTRVGLASGSARSRRARSWAARQSLPRESDCPTEGNGARTFNCRGEATAASPIETASERRSLQERSAARRPPWGSTVSPFERRRTPAGANVRWLLRSGCRAAIVLLATVAVGFARGSSHR
jgi:hypothetical protein